jgi:CBS domain-containing protein
MGESRFDPGGTGQILHWNERLLGTPRKASLMELARNLKVESVSRLLPGPPVIMAEEQTVQEAVESMRRYRVGCVVVCRDDRPVGIFTERDLLRRVLAEDRPFHLPLKDCMTPDPVVVELKDSINTALRLMEEGGYRHLPVVDSAGRPRGVLSVKRIVHYLVEHFPATIHNQPPEPHCYPSKPEGA